MSKQKIGELPGQIYSLLEPLDAEDRQRVLRSAMALFGDEAEVRGPGVPIPPGGVLQGGNAGGVQIKGGDLGAEYLKKSPGSKMESLAVMAQLLERKTGGTILASADFKTGFDDARQRFDSKNFSFDMRNAKSAGFFIDTPKAGTYKLSYNGHLYVDSLPDREAARKHLRAKGAAKRKAGKSGK